MYEDKSPAPICAVFKRRLTNMSKTMSAVTDVPACAISVLLIPWRLTQDFGSSRTLMFVDLANVRCRTTNFKKKTVPLRAECQGFHTQCVRLCSEKADGHYLGCGMPVDPMTKMMV